MQREIQQFMLDEFLFKVSFCTRDSVSFDMIDAGTSLIRGATRGWVDVHWSAELRGDRAFLRAAVPARCLELEFMKQLIDAVVHQLSVPKETQIRTELYAIERSLGMTREAE